MPWQDTAVALIVIVGFFLVIYSAMRKQGIEETAREIKSIFQDEIVDKTKETLKYA